MFEKFVLRRSENGEPISLGQIAEALLFYQKVHFVLDGGSVAALCKSMGPELFLALLSRPNVSAVYCEEFLGVRTDSGSFETHSFIAGRFAGTSQNKLLNRRQRLEHLFEKIGCDRKRAGRLTERFQALVRAKSLTDDYFVEGGIPKAAQADALDSKFISDAIKAAISALVGHSIPVPSFDFELVPAGGGGFHVASNLDLAWLSRALIKSEPDAKVTFAGLLSHVLTARADLAFASHYGADFQTSTISSQIIALRHSDLLRRGGINAAEIDEFRSVVLAEAPSLREAIDSGARSFADFMKFIDGRQQKKFQQWVGKVSSDDKLVAAYFAEVRAQSWIERLPAKITRYVLTSGAGFAGVAVGLAASAADSFLVERMFGGWRPNHFIEGPYKEFVGEPL